MSVRPNPSSWHNHVRDQEEDLVRQLLQSDNIDAVLERISNDHYKHLTPIMKKLSSFDAPQVAAPSPPISAATDAPAPGEESPHPVPTPGAIPRVEPTTRGLREPAASFNGGRYQSSSGMYPFPHPAVSDRMNTTDRVGKEGDQHANAWVPSRTGRGTGAAAAAAVAPQYDNNGNSRYAPYGDGVPPRQVPVPSGPETRGLHSRRISELVSPVPLQDALETPAVTNRRDPYAGINSSRAFYGRGGATAAAAAATSGVDNVGDNGDGNGAGGFVPHTREYYMRGLNPSGNTRSDYEWPLATPTEGAGAPNRFMMPPSPGSPMSMTPYHPQTTEFSTSSPLFGNGAAGGGGALMAPQVSTRLSASPSMPMPALEDPSQSRISRQLQLLRNYRELAELCSKTDDPSVNLFNGISPEKLARAQAEQMMAAEGGRPVTVHNNYYFNATPDRASSGAPQAKGVHSRQNSRSRQSLSLGGAYDPNMREVIGNFNPNTTTNTNTEDGGGRRSGGNDGKRSTLSPTSSIPTSQQQQASHAPLVSPAISSAPTSPTVSPPQTPSTQHDPPKRQNGPAGALAPPSPSRSPKSKSHRGHRSTMYYDEYNTPTATTEEAGTSCQEEEDFQGDFLGDDEDDFNDSVFYSQPPRIIEREQHRRTPAGGGGSFDTRGNTLGTMQDTNISGQNNNTNNTADFHGDEEDGEADPLPAGELNDLRTPAGAVSGGGGGGTMDQRRNSHIKVLSGNDELIANSSRSQTPAAAELDPYQPTASPLSSLVKSPDHLATASGGSSAPGGGGGGAGNATPEKQFLNVQKDSQKRADGHRRSDGSSGEDDEDDTPGNPQLRTNHPGARSPGSRRRPRRRRLRDDYDDNDPNDSRGRRSSRRNHHSRSDGSGGRRRHRDRGGNQGNRTPTSRRERDRDGKDYKPSKRRGAGTREEEGDSWYSSDDYSYSYYSDTSHGSSSESTLARRHRHNLRGATTSPRGRGSGAPQGRGASPGASSNRGGRGRGGSGPQRSSTQPQASTGPRSNGASVSPNRRMSMQNSSANFSRGNSPQKSAATSGTVREQWGGNSPGRGRGRGGISPTRGRGRGGPMGMSPMERQQQSPGSRQRPQPLQQLYPSSGGPPMGQQVPPPQLMRGRGRGQGTSPLRGSGGRPPQQGPGSGDTPIMYPRGGGVATPLRQRTPGGGSRPMMREPRPGGVPVGPYGQSPQQMQPPHSGGSVYRGNNRDGNPLTLNESIVGGGPPQIPSASRPGTSNFFESASNASAIHPGLLYGSLLPSAKFKTALVVPQNERDGRNAYYGDGRSSYAPVRSRSQRAHSAFGEEDRSYIDTFPNLPAAHAPPHGKAVVGDSKEVEPLVWKSGSTGCVASKHHHVPTRPDTKLSSHYRAPESAARPAPPQQQQQQQQQLSAPPQSTVQAPAAYYPPSQPQHQPPAVVPATYNNTSTPRQQVSVPTSVAPTPVSRTSNAHYAATSFAPGVQNANANAQRFGIVQLPA